MPYELLNSKGGLEITGQGTAISRITAADLANLTPSLNNGDEGKVFYLTDTNQYVFWNGSAIIYIADAGTSVNEQVIFNDNGILDGDPGLLYNKLFQRLTVGTNINIWRGGLNDGTSTAVGSRTLELTAAGAVDNTAIGYRSMYRALTASGNTAVGANTLSSNFFTGSGNVAVGYNALSASTVSNLTAIGYAALDANTTGANNTAVGFNSLGSLVSNSNCTAMGHQAAAVTTAADVTAIGSNALALATGGAANTAVGSGAMGSAIVTGINNTCIGTYAGAGITTGGGNVFLGYDVCSTTNVGASNIGIGSGVRSSATSISNELAIGSNAAYVATNAGPTTYYATATAGAVALPVASLGFIRIYLNGAFVKLAVYGN